MNERYEAEIDLEAAEEASNREIDARMEQIKSEKVQMLLEDPFNARKLGDLIEAYYGHRFPREHVKIWYDEYCRRNLKGEMIDSLDFVAELDLDSI